MNDHPEEGQPEYPETWDTVSSLPVVESDSTRLVGAMVLTALVSVLFSLGVLMLVYAVRAR